MRASEIITQLQTSLPQITGLFTKNVDVESVVRAGTILTVKCKEVHEAEVNDIVSLVGARTPLAITAGTRTDTVGLLTLAADHDLVVPKKTGETFEISGSSSATFNGVWPLLTGDVDPVTSDTSSIPMRDQIRFSMPDSGDTSISDGFVLDAASYLQTYNLPYCVQSVLSPTSFTILHPGTTLLDPVGAIVARVSPRVSGGVQVDRMIEAYTKKETGEYWLQVVLDDVDASRDLQSRSDATINRSRTGHYRQQVLEPFHVYLFLPASEELSARAAADIARDVFPFICRCLLAHRFDSGLTDTEQGATGFLSHGFQDYTGAVYVHRYSFLQVVDLTWGDTVGASQSVAFRDIALTLTPSTGSATIHSDINLDHTIP